VYLAIPVSARAQAGAADHQALQRLQSALEVYRSIAQTGGWPIVPPGLLLEIGVDDPRVAVLRRRLAIEGDLAQTATQTATLGTRFDAQLAIAVERFQARHGLQVDGRVGANTYRALNMPAPERVAQIATNLARWRDVPTDLPPRRLEINIPSSELALFEDGRQIGGMRVIVGTPRNPTPLLQSRVVAVVFNPPWNVPVAIARNEILPRLASDPGYLRREDIRILDRDFDPYGEEIDWASPDRPRTLLLQQRPGPRNALGRIKFDIPNAYSVYLHDTPNKTPFEKAARALSHGCVRLQHPESLVRYVLREQLRTDPGLVDRMLASGETVHVRVGEPLPVFTFYWTAFVTADGQVNFRPDIYGRDALPERREMVADVSQDRRAPPAKEPGAGCGGRVHAG